MNKLKSLFDTAVKYPKATIISLLLIGAAGYWGYTRIPAASKCAYAAMVDQSVPWELWRFNFMAMNCQYYNGTRWIPLLKVVDVGGGSAEDVQ